MGEILNNIAHHWRQPLNVMGLIVQEIPMMYGSSGFTEEYLNAQVEKVKEYIFQMSRTIETFRTFFSPSRETLEFKASEAIAKALELVKGNLDDFRIGIEVEQVGEPVIYGYFNELSQVIVNMLLNARDAFEELEKAEERCIRVRTFYEAGKTVITVADNAGGIPEEVIGKIFEPYFTTKGPDKGAGIGLFMAKNIIEKHMDGRVTVQCIDGGTEFRIEVSGKPC
jgi:C4-dicarboxylate-specific signal transduction histidine kinase